MNVGIIVYSHSGNTKSVARKLHEKLVAKGHQAGIEEVVITGEATPGSKDFQLTAIPEVEGFEALIFGSPVQAFALNPAMKAYLEQLPSLAGKKVACFVTKQLPFYWTGGKQALGKINNICQAKGAEILGSEIVVWSSSNRDRAIEQCTDNLSNLF